MDKRPRWDDQAVRPVPVGDAGFREGTATTRQASGARLIKQLGVQVFRPRPVDVSAMLNDGTPGRTDAMTAWVRAVDAGGGTWVETVEGRLVVMVERPSVPGFLWVLPGQHLVLDHRGTPRWRVYGQTEFSALFARPVRELPIFDDGEVA